MTLRDAHAVNEVAAEILKIAGREIHISPALECAIAVLLINAERRLDLKADAHFGYTPKSFLTELSSVRGKA